MYIYIYILKKKKWHYTSLIISLIRFDVENFLKDKIGWKKSDVDLTFNSYTWLTRPSLIILLHWLGLNTDFPFNSYHWPPCWLWKDLWKIPLNPDQCNEIRQVRQINQMPISNWYRHKQPEMSNNQSKLLNKIFYLLYTSALIIETNMQRL